MPSALTNVCFRGRERNPTTYEYTRRGQGSPDGALTRARATSGSRDSVCRRRRRSDRWRRSAAGVGRQRDVERGEVVVEVIARFRRWDRDHVAALMQEPGERQRCYRSVCRLWTQTRSLDSVRVWFRLSHLRLLHGDLMIRAIDVDGLDVCGNVPLVSMVAYLCPHFAAKYPVGPTRVDENDG